MDGTQHSGENTGESKTTSPDGHDEGSEEDEEFETEEDQLWNTFLAEKREKGEVKSCEGLECFLDGKERWKVANEKLDRALQKYMSKSDEYMQAVIHRLVKPIRATSYQEADELLANCKSHLIGGHRRRQACFKKLHEADRKSKVAFNVLIARTMDEEEPVLEEIPDDVTQASFLSCFSFVVRFFVLFSLFL